MKLLPLLLLAITALCWGSTPILEKVGLKEVDPFVGVTVRSMAITAVLLAVAALSGRLRDIFSVDLRTVVIFSSSGILAGLLGMWTYFWALKMGATSRVVPIAASYPLVTALLGMLLLGEQVTLLRFLGIVLIVVGIWLVK
ncbi:MAG: hypothetical protein DRG55_05845 [Deltaproteobacteria bacterium]|nr:MAG: hypothetical protein DRG69_02835 [Deltaproteobacteria bacterium]RLB00946.1 MAG: hypothetical protein DRG55_05845 [Deltaproteobacteria bacterium]